MLSPVVGRVEHLEKIEGADLIRRACVHIGVRDLRIVFGGRLDALAVGDLVPVAPPGSRVARWGTRTNTKIRTRRYRGELSEGMLCSVVELGWTDHGPDEVPRLMRGVVGEPLPFDVVLDEWLRPDFLERYRASALAPETIPDVLAISAPVLTG